MWWTDCWCPAVQLLRPVRPPPGGAALQADCFGPPARPAPPAAGTTGLMTFLGPNTGLSSQPVNNIVIVIRPIRSNPAARRGIPAKVFCPAGGSINEEIIATHIAGGK